MKKTGPFTADTDRANTMRHFRAGRSRLSITLCLVFFSLLSLPHPTQAQTDWKEFKRHLKDTVKRERINKRYTRKLERTGKQRRRKLNGRVRSFTYDFQLAKFVCDESNNDRSSPTRFGCNPPYEIHEMDAVRIKINNINPFIYTVNLYELQGDQISNENLTQENSSRSLTLDFKAISPIAFERLGLATTTDPTNLKIIQRQETAERQLNRLNQVLTSAKIAGDSLARVRTETLSDSLKKNTDLNKLDERIERNSDSVKNINILIQKAADTLFVLGQRRKIQADTEAKLKGREMDLQRRLSDLQTSSNEINKLIHAYNTALFLIHSPTNDIHIIRSYLNSAFPMKEERLITSYSDNAATILGIIREAYLLLQDLQQLNDMLMAANKTNVNREDKYNLIRQYLEAFEKEFRAFDGNSLIGQIMFIKTMVTPEHFSIVYETHAIAENADYLKYRFEFRPTQLSDFLAQGASPSNLDLAFKIYEGAKFDISSGFVLDIGLVDPSYYFDKSADSTGATVIVRKGENGSMVNPSIAAFLNGYKRTSANLKLGATLGVGLNNNARFRLYGGPSLIVGRKERVVISAGVSFGAVARLANGYKENMSLENNTSLPNSVPMEVDRFNFGGFFGVGFNLTGKENKSFLEKIKFN